MTRNLKIEIINPVGLYAIPASEIVGICKDFQSDIYLTYNGKKVNMKSVMGVLSLGIPKGGIIDIEFNGFDEYDAHARIKNEFEKNGLGKII